MNIFYNNLCHVCKTTSVDLKRCASCKVMGYCSKEHQKHDWKHHKQLCRIICDSDKNVIYEVGCSFENFVAYKVAKQTFWQSKLDRSLQPFECQMWMFPRACNVCYAKSNLKDCDNCLNVAYCSLNHYNVDKQSHMEHCDELKLCMLTDSFLFRKKSVAPVNVPQFDDTTVSLPNDLQCLMALFGDNPPSQCSSNVEDRIENILRSDILAPAATILYCLEHVNLIKNRRVKTSMDGQLVIHLVGASNFELCLDWITILEFFFHWIKNLKTIEISLVGPELNCTNPCIEFPDHFCQSCQQKNFTTLLKGHKNLYNIIRHQLTKPDIVVAFNSGLHEFEDTTQDTWKDSLDGLVEHSCVPLLLTAYTEKEILKDSGRFKGVSGMQIVLEPQRNPFSNARPLRDWCSRDKPVFHVNGYVAVLVKEAM